MNTKTFRAATKKQALSRISRELGPDATIISHRKVTDKDGKEWIEVEARTATSVPDSTVSSSSPSALPNRRIIALAGLSVLIAIVITVAVIFWPRATVEVAPVTVPEEMPTIAILYFENGTGDENLDHWRTSIADLLTIDLQQSRHLRVVGGDKIYQILKDLEQLDAPSFSSDILAKVAAETYASHIITGRYMLAGERFLLTLRLQDSSTGELIATEKVEGRGEESIFANIDGLTRKVKINLDFNNEKIEGDIDKSIQQITTSSLEALQFYYDAAKYKAKEDTDVAIALAEKAIEIDPEFAMAYREIGICYWNDSNLTKAYEYLGKALSFADRISDRERLKIEGDYYSLTFDTMDKSIEAYQKLLDIYPNSTTARNNMALTYGQMEEYDKAYKHLQAGINVAGIMIILWGNYATCTRKLGQPEKAIEIMEDAKKRFGGNNLFYRQVIWSNIILGNLSAAEEELKKLLAIDPDNFRTGALETTIAMLKDELDQAEELINKLIVSENEFHNYTGLVRLKDLNLLTGNIGEAVTHYKLIFDYCHKAKRDPLGFNYSLAKQYTLLGNYQSAKEVVAKGKEYYLSTPLKSYRMYKYMNRISEVEGEILVKTGELTEAEQAATDLKEVISKYPYRLQIRYYYLLKGKIEVAKKNYQTAIDYFNQAISLLPKSYLRESSELVYPLAEAYYLSGNPEKAIEQYQIIESSHLRSSLPLRYVLSLYNLGKIYQELGDSDQAIKYYKKFLFYWGDADPELKEPDDARAQLAILQN